jgi:hypothetical protein
LDGRPLGIALRRHQGARFSILERAAEIYSEGGILALENVPSWQADARLGEDRAPAEHPYVWPAREDPNPLTVNPCTQGPIPPEQQDTGAR